MNPQTTLGGTIQLKAGIAIVSVAAVGVSPTAQRRTDNRTHGCVVRALGLVGGTPTSAGETPALPKKELNRYGLAGTIQFMIRVAWATGPCRRATSPTE